ncbi:PEP-CTERM sorting domain-containing protein [Roseateles chitinivorans]|uniref:PEP-CTERM sorting domain-containing protein n=1 Tax=Roseateles chitinivorans TaxID=2917965 RepID=UPI003D674F82
MKFQPLALALGAFLALGGLNAHADIVAQWDYNKGSTKHSQSMNGASFATLGGVTTSFVAQTGSSDPNAGQAMNTASYAAQGTGSLTRGVQFGVDTTAYENIVLTFDQRNSATASAWTALLYTIDGENWSQATTFKMATGNLDFVKGLSFDFSSIAGVADNTNFAFQLVSMFAPGTSSYLATGATSNYGPAGTIRYDMVTISGTEIIAAAVPEPESYALMLAGLGAMALVLRRRQRQV